MKKYISYIVLLFAGLLLGWFLFGTSSNEKTAHEHSEVSETAKMWTCSMHPQIMQPEAGDCPICGMDLIPAETSADGLNANEFKLTKNAMALANVRTSIIGKRNTEDKAIKLSGKIVENEDNSAIQPAHFNGRIEKLYVKYLGKKVTKGQAVAQIYSAELTTAQQELITTYSLRETQPELYKAVYNKFKNWKIHDGQIEEVLKTGKIKTSFTIYSHVSGVITEISVSEGAHIMDGKPIFKVSNLSTVWANFDVYENQIDLFKKGQEVAITTKAFANKEFKGKVTFIDPILDTKTRIVKLRVVLDNAAGNLKPGMFVEGKIKGTISAKKQVVMIPASAIMWTGKRSVVYVKTNKTEPIFEMKEITIGNKIGEHYEVVDGLNDGDEIVTNGTFTIDASAQLQGKKSMMNKTGGATTTGHENHLETEATTTLKIERLNVSSTFQKQLKVVFDNYITLKNILVNDDENKVVTAAKNVLQSVVKVDMKLLKDKNAHEKWMSFEKEIKTAVTAISKTFNIKEHRNHFIQLSTNLIGAVETFGIQEKVYRQFCPMADANNGAYWLSKEEKILNPYFGDAMLSCGSVAQIIE
ncbi:efflux RND transporter periplasmic adaptor subunit [Polaribacter uvawellassae]|uniref:efflux RND transporter periplasmic adaptor subunit n=1 Tax=Polaribacter uvawellassae TaxID=3133495 RepID=UPI00321A45A5